MANFNDMQQQAQTAFTKPVEQARAMGFELENSSDLTRFIKATADSRD